MISLVLKQKMATFVSDEHFTFTTMLAQTGKQTHFRLSWKAKKQLIIHCRFSSLKLKFSLKQDLN